jgi:predicted GNAT family acetyltransferase
LLAWCGSVPCTPRSGTCTGTAAISSSCLAAVSEHVLSQKLRCILYTDLGNPTSNSIYRSVGYRSVAEALLYRFA